MQIICHPITCFPCYFPLLSCSPFTYHTNEFENSVIAVKFPAWKCNRGQGEENYQSPATEQIMILVFAAVLFPKNSEKLGRPTPPVSISSIRSGLMCVWLWSSLHTLGCFPYCAIIMLSVRHIAETPRECRIAPLDNREKCSGRESASSFPTHRKMKFLYTHIAYYPCSCCLSLLASVTLVMVMSQHQ